MFSIFTYIYVIIFPMVLPLYFDEVSNLGDSPTRPWDPKEIFAPAKNAFSCCQPEMMQTPPDCVSVLHVVSWRDDIDSL